MTDTKIKVIIVEDEAIFALELKYKLIKWGFEVTSLVNNHYAAIFEAKKKTPDIALMDINIKGVINGIETAEYLEKLFNISSLFITSQDDNETKERVSAFKHIGFLSKPLNETQFHRIMEDFQMRHLYHY